MKNYKYVILLLFLATIINAQEGLISELPPPPPFPAFKISEKSEKEYLKNVDAELRLKLELIKKHNKHDYYALLSRLQFGNFEHLIIDGDDKENRKLGKKVLEYEVDTKAIVAKIQDASSAEKTKLKKELENSVSKLFDLKEEMRKKEIKRLEKRLSELNKKLKVRSKMKDEIVRRRVQELLGENDYLDWE